MSIYIWQVPTTGSAIGYSGVLTTVISTLIFSALNRD